MGSIAIQQKWCESFVGGRGCEGVAALRVGDASLQAHLEAIQSSRTGTEKEESG